MSVFVISLLISLGAAGWLYSRIFSRRSGEGNNGPVIIGTAVSAVVIFVVVYLTLGTILNR